MIITIALGVVLGLFVWHNAAALLILLVALVLLPFQILAALLRLPGRILRFLFRPRPHISLGEKLGIAGLSVFGVLVAGAMIDAVMFPKKHPGTVTRSITTKSGITATWQEPLEVGQTRDYGNGTTITRTK